jgi:hypothetical protein
MGSRDRRTLHRTLSPSCTHHMLVRKRRRGCRSCRAPCKAPRGSPNSTGMRSGPPRSSGSRRSRGSRPLPRPLRRGSPAGGAHRRTPPRATPRRSPRAERRNEGGSKRRSLGRVQQRRCHRFSTVFRKDTPFDSASPCALGLPLRTHPVKGGTCNSTGHEGPREACLVRHMRHPSRPVHPERKRGSIVARLAFASVGFALTACGGNSTVVVDESPSADASTLAVIAAIPIAPSSCTPADPSCAIVAQCFDHPLAANGQVPPCHVLVIGASACVSPMVAPSREVVAQAGLADTEETVCEIPPAPEGASCVLGDTECGGWCYELGSKEGLCSSKGAHASLVSFQPLNLSDAVVLIECHAGEL